MEAKNPKKIRKNFSFSKGAPFGRSGKRGVVSKSDTTHIKIIIGK